MTREEAIERLNIHKSTSVFVDSIAEAIDMAIEALSAEEEKENGTFVNRDNWNFNCNDSNRALVDVPSGDLISRADAIEAVCGKCSAETRMECALNGYFCCDRRELEALPSADAVQGEWGGNHALGWKCSKCGIITNLASNFCPCCGADMRGADR